MKIERNDVAKKGKLIVFEGGDGAGKTEHIEALQKVLVARGLPVVVTYEPGRTPAGKIIRGQILFDKRYCLSPRTQMLLFFADRSDHLEKEVLPALAEGKIVIVDRFYFSTWAYQICGGQLGKRYEDFFYTLLQEVVGDLRPDLVIMLDIDPKEGLERAAKRGQELTAFEQEDLDYHRRVREGLKKIIKVQMDSHEYVIINTSPSKEEVHQKILEAVERLDFI